jgi:hypothetical protein
MVAQAVTAAVEEFCTIEDKPSLADSRRLNRLVLCPDWHYCQRLAPGPLRTVSPVLRAQSVC